MVRAGCQDERLRDPSRASWQELKPLSVSRAKHPEVAMVERREFRLIEPLDDRQDRGVHEADVRVAIRSHNARIRA